jgi:hypothetical protein
MANASKKMGAGIPGPKGFAHVGPQDPDVALDEDDFASEIKGRNSLQGNDQRRVHSERHVGAGAVRKTEGVIESFENMDPKARASRN